MVELSAIPFWGYAIGIAIHCAAILLLTLVIKVFKEERSFSAAAPITFLAVALTTLPVVLLTRMLQWAIGGYSDTESLYYLALYPLLLSVVTGVFALVLHIELSRFVWQTREYLPKWQRTGYAICAVVLPLAWIEMMVGGYTTHAAATTHQMAITWAELQPYNAFAISVCAITAVSSACYMGYTLWVLHRRNKGLST